mmetsp:Transcript_23876/g.75072  ORF Transcript_23876/g.75072 Transcript_23876/m.75072 type:complete len:90 (+) Transcript_23876:248-517(+)
MMDAALVPIPPIAAAATALAALPDGLVDKVEHVDFPIGDCTQKMTTPFRTSVLRVHLLPLLLLLLSLLPKTFPRTGTHRPTAGPPRGRR